MRIRLKQGVALVGAIAGAAVATTLIIVNVNNGGDNASDIEEVGVLNIDDAIDQALSDATAEATAAAISDAQSGDAAVLAGLIGDGFGTGENTTPIEPQGTQSNDAGTATSSSAGDDNTGSGSTPAQTGQGQVEQVTYGGTPTNQAAGDQVETYVEAVPQTRTETVVSERTVYVDNPVTVTTQVPVQEPVTGNFYEQSGNAVSETDTEAIRQQEAAAARKADEDRLRAAAEAAGNNQEFSDKTGDDVTNSSSGDEFIIFY